MSSGSTNRNGTGKAQVRDWIDAEVRKQLGEYLNSVDMQEKRKANNVRAYAVVFVGSRKILFVEMDANGHWTDTCVQLAEKPASTRTAGDGGEVRRLAEWIAPGHWRVWVGGDILVHGIGSINTMEDHNPRTFMLV